MKTKSKLAIMAIASIAALPVLAGPGVGVSIQVGVPAPPPPVVVVPTPAPAVTVVVPDSYVYDGTEYVGVVDGQYYYLGDGNVWMPMDPPHLARFNVYIGHHSDWRSHTIVNEKYRYDAHHHYAPYKGDHQSDHHDQDMNHDRDHGH